MPRDASSSRATSTPTSTSTRRWRGGCPYRLEPPPTSSRSSSGSGGASTGPRRRDRPRLRARRRPRGAPGRHDDARRPPRLAERHRRLARRHRRGLRRSGLRSCAATRSPTATGRSGRGQASPRTSASSGAGRRRAAPGAGMVGAHASFTLSDETAGRLRRPGRGHGRRPPRPRRRGRRRRGRRRATARGPGGAPPGRRRRARTTGRCSPTASTSTRTRRELVRDAGATLVHNPRSNMNNAVGVRRSARLGDRGRARHGRHRQRHVRRVAGRLLPLARRRRRAGPDWPLARLPRRRPAPVASGSRLGASSRARRPTWSSSTTTRRRRSRRRVARRPLAVRPGRAGSGTSSWRARSSSRPPSRRSTRTSSRRGPRPGRPPLGTPRRRRRPPLRPCAGADRCPTASTRSRWSSSPTGSSPSSSGKGSLFNVPRSAFFVPRPDHRFRRPCYGQRARDALRRGGRARTRRWPRTSSRPGSSAPASSSSRPSRPSTSSTSTSPASTCRTRATTSSGRRSCRVHESFDEYLRAWVLIHALHHRSGWPGERPASSST